MHNDQYNLIDCIQQSSCRFTGDRKGAQMSGSIKITSGIEDNLQAAVAYTGPIAVAVDAI